MRRAAGWAAIGLGVVLACPLAAADGARGVASAGAIVASVDDETALAVNPAGLARAGGLRLAATLGIVRSFGRTSGASDRAGGSFTLSLGAQLPIADKLVAGVSFVWPTAIERAYDDGALAPARYAGTRLSLDERGLALALAIRVKPWLAVGVAAGALRVDLAAERVLFGGDPTGISDPSELPPGLDLGFAADGADGFVPTATLGLLAAPDAVPIELGLGLRWVGGTEVTGRASLANSRDGTIRPSPSEGPARLGLPGKLGLGVGARLLASRGAVEIAGEIVWLTGERDPAWEVDDVALAPVPLGPAFARTQAAVRAAGDFDLVRGLLTLTVGGAWERGPVRADSIGPLAPASGAWIAAAGLSARVERARLGFAVRHRIADRSEVGDALRVQRRTGPTDLPAQTGQVSGGTTTFVMGLTIDFP